MPENTATGSPARDIVGAFEAYPVSKTDITAAELERSLEKEKEQRKEERFLWAFAVNLLASALIYPLLPGAVMIGIFLLNIVFLIALARWCEVDWVVVLFERLLRRFLAKSDEE